MNTNRDVNASIRADMRRRRRELSAEQRLRASLNLAHHAWPWLDLLLAHHKQPANVAGYWAVQGEMPLSALASRLAREHTFLLPCVDDHHHMTFAAQRENTDLRPNCYGIPEPNVPASQQLPPDALDIVLVPMLAFGKNGARLGAGGGYYDRSFAFRHPDKPAKTKPWLIGIAYGFQYYEDLQPQAWDVPMDLILTDQGSYPISPQLRDRTPQTP